MKKINFAVLLLSCTFGFNAFSMKYFIDVHRILKPEDVKIVVWYKEQQISKNRRYKADNYIARSQEYDRVGWRNMQLHRELIRDIANEKAWAKVDKKDAKLAELNETKKLIDESYNAHCNQAREACHKDLKEINGGSLWSEGS